MASVVVAALVVVIAALVVLLTSVIIELASRTSIIYSPPVLTAACPLRELALSSIVSSPHVPTAVANIYGLNAGE